MKCLVIDGSGHEGGCTDRVCGRLSSALSDAGAETIVLRIPSQDITLCRGCGSCRDGPCPIRDGIADIVGTMPSCDTVVLASPIRFSGLSSQTKALIDRMNVFWYDGRLKGRGLYAVLAAGQTDPCFSNACSELRQLAAGTGMVWGGQLEIPGTDTRGAAGIPELADGFAALIAGKNNRNSAGTSSRRTGIRRKGI